MGMLRLLGKFLLAFVIFTVLGQLSYNEQTLEQRYHRWVNSESFQRYYEKATFPVFWTKEQIVQFIEERKSQPGKSQAR